jgi:hypothetical protein
VSPDNGERARRVDADWLLDAGCWLLKHFRRSKNRLRVPEGEEAVFNASAVVRLRGAFDSKTQIMIYYAPSCEKQDNEHV